MSLQTHSSPLTQSAYPCYHTLCSSCFKRIHCPSDIFSYFPMSTVVMQASFHTKKFFHFHLYIFSFSSIRAFTQSHLFGFDQYDSYALLFLFYSILYKHRSAMYILCFVTHLLPFHADIGDYNCVGQGVYIFGEDDEWYMPHLIRLPLPIAILSRGILARRKAIRKQ